MFGIMGVMGIVITVVMVGGSLFGAFRVLGSLGAGEKRRQELLRTGLPAHARILGMQMGNMAITTGVHRQLQLQLSLEVHRAGAAPYQAALSTLVSELQIPLVQPGAWLAVRVDATNPMSLAIESMGVAAPGSTPMADAPVGAAAGAVGAAGTMIMAPVGVAPMGGFKLPLGAKIGLGIGVASAVIGIVVAIVVTSWTSGVGGPSATCKTAAACCRKVAGGHASTSCDNLTKQSGPAADMACEQTLRGYRQAGKCK